MVLRPKDIVVMQDRLFNHCKAQAQKKGNDYSGKAEDTFSNLRRVKDFGITKNDMGTVLAEMVKKCSRLANFSQPGFVSQVTEESAFDTISDLINYATYWQMFFEESKGLKATPKWSKEDDDIFKKFEHILLLGDSSTSKTKIIKSVKKWNKKKNPAPKRKTSVKPKRKGAKRK